MVKTTARTVRVEDALWDDASAAAKANGENVSVVIRRALIQYVKENDSTPGRWTVQSTGTLATNVQEQS